MNTSKNPFKKTRKPFFQSKMVFQLWLMMMGLVLFTILFMWIVQIFLFEHSYTKAALDDTWMRLEPVMERLQNGEFSDDDRFLPFLSRVTDGHIVLVDENGDPAHFFASRYEIQISPEDPDLHFWEDICYKEAAASIKNRTAFQSSHVFGRHASSVLLGIPIQYDGKDSYLILHHELNLDTILKLNRKQLMGLSLFLTLAASVLAAVCSKGFTQPLYVIRDTIDRLAKNDFAAELDFTRQDEIGRLADSVNLLGNALKRIDVLRKELIANVSHELKSPLSLISGYAEMVRDIDWRNDERREEDLNLIIHESGRMSEMVNDILDYSQLQSGYLRIKPDIYNLCELVESEAAHCAAGAAEYQIVLDFQSEPDSLSVYADALKMTQVLRNLLYNAINHTPENGLISIRLTRSGDRFRLSVSNPGDPIPEEDREIIWERYQRSQHQNGRHMGTGIGLSIVRSILEAHHMPYGVDCAGGQTIFWFECEEAEPRDS